MKLFEPIIPKQHVIANKSEANKILRRGSDLHLVTLGDSTNIRMATEAKETINAKTPKPLITGVAMLNVFRKPPIWEITVMASSMVLALKKIHAKQTNTKVNSTRAECIKPGGRI